MKVDKYYIISEKFSMDSNQWSILIGATGVFLTLIGFLIAYLIYNRQRNDNAKDAFIFFQASLHDLKTAIIDTIDNLNRFIDTLQNEEPVNPILSASLNDKFINKLNIVDLNRYYLKSRKNNINYFRQFLVDTNFFSGYHSYFTNEINYFRNNHFEKEKIYSNWQLLRSNKFFASIGDVNEQDEYKSFYVKWREELNKDSDVFATNGKEIKVKNRNLLVQNHIVPLAKGIVQYIPFSEKANEVYLIANQVNSSFNDILNMNNQMKNVMEKDIKKFNTILKNLDLIIENG